MKDYFDITQEDFVREKISDLQKAIYLQENFMGIMREFPFLSPIILPFSIIANVIGANYIIDSRENLRGLISEEEIRRISEECRR